MKQRVTYFFWRWLLQFTRAFNRTLQVYFCVYLHQHFHFFWTSCNWHFTSVSMWQWNFFLQLLPLLRSQFWRLCRSIDDKMNGMLYVGLLYLFKSFIPQTCSHQYNVCEVCQSSSLVEINLLIFLVVLFSIQSMNSMVHGLKKCQFLNRNCSRRTENWVWKNWIFEFFPLNSKVKENIEQFRKITLYR